MKKIVILALALVVLVACGPAPVEQDTGKKPTQMPGGAGVTAGQSGTGTTNGGSTGY